MVRLPMLTVIWNRPLAKLGSDPSPLALTRNESHSIFRNMEPLFLFEAVFYAVFTLSNVDRIVLV